MMTEKLENILKATEDAIKAARINHWDALQEAIDTREKLLLNILGMEDKVKLPQFEDSSGHLRSKITGRSERKLLKKILHYEDQLFDLIEFKFKTISIEEGQMRGGRRFLNSARSTLGSRTGTRMNRQI